MEPTQFLQGLFEYDYWGNREVLASLRSRSSDRAIRFFNHIIGAQRIWLARFQNPDPRSIEVWPSLTLEECQGAVDELHQRWTGLLSSLNPPRLAEKLVYRNTQGAEFKTPILDVLMHLIVHSAYHRGQVAAALREAGATPPATDYVVYVRKLESHVRR